MPSPTYDSILENGDYGVEIKSSLPYHTHSSSARWQEYAVIFWEAVRPSILIPKQPGQEKPLRRTAYLDGMRGLAAFMVYWGHHQLWARDVIGAGVILENAWGYENRWYFCTLPVVRLAFSGGHFAVTVLFVISGYVLSVKPLSLIQSGEYLKLSENLGSALFRRWLRLYIPVIVTTFVFMTSWHLFGIWTATPEHQKTYWDEIWHYYYEFKNFSFAFKTGGDGWFSYNFHTWSIPVEFRGSIIIYTALAAFARCTRNARLWCEAGLIFYFMYIVDGAHYSMFMAGLFLCDIDLLTMKDDLPAFFSRFEQHKNAIYYTMFGIALYLGGVPSYKSDIKILRASPGWKFLSYFKPQAVFDYKWFYLFFASTFVIISVPRIPPIKRFFETRFCQYLGKLSFSFYLVHGPVLWTLGDRIYVGAGWAREVHGGALPNWINAFPMSKAGPLGLEISFLVPHLILLPVTLWLAEIVERLVDGPSVTFAAWLYKKATGPKP